MTSNSNKDIRSPEFTIEYYADSAHLQQRDKDTIEARIYKLARGYRDIAGASVAIECVSGANKRAEYKARLVVYCKPANVVSSRTHDSVQTAVSDALEAVERQIREQRERMRDRHRGARTPL